MATDDAAGHDPADAFGAVSNEIRIDIIRAFIEELRRIRDAQVEDVTELMPTLTFSELQDAVGVEDSGKFNYHLGELTGRYLHRAEEGYQITWAGLEVAGSILAGGYGDVEIERQAIDRRCPSCGGDLEATYHLGTFLLFCGDSEDLVLASGVPAGVFEGRSLEAAADVALSVQRTIQTAATDGYCPLCYGGVEMQLGPSTEQGLISDSEYALRGSCDRCGNVYMVAVATSLLDHPAVVAFYHDHGVDVRERLTEAFDPIGQETDIETVVSEEPLRVAATFEVDGDELRVVVDEDGSVIETERV